MHGSLRTGLTPAHASLLQASVLTAGIEAARQARDRALLALPHEPPQQEQPRTFAGIWEAIVERPQSLLHSLEGRREQQPAADAAQERRELPALRSAGHRRGGWSGLPLFKPTAADNEPAAAVPDQAAAAAPSQRRIQPWPMRSMASEAVGGSQALELPSVRAERSRHCLRKAHHAAAAIERGAAAAGVLMRKHARKLGRPERAHRHAPDHVVYCLTDS